MQKFIPFEDDWEALEHLRAEDLVPFHVGMLAAVSPEAQWTALRAPSIFNTSPALNPIRCAVPAGNSST